MYYALTSAYQSKIDPDRFFATEQAAHEYDLKVVKDYLGFAVFEEFVAGDRNSRTFRMCQYAIDLATDSFNQKHLLKEAVNG